MRRKASIVLVLETDRLILRQLSTEDAEFILELVNEPAWLRFAPEPQGRSIRNQLLR